MIKRVLIQNLQRKLFICGFWIIWIQTFKERLRFLYWYRKVLLLFIQRSDDFEKYVIKKVLSLSFRSKSNNTLLREKGWTLRSNKRLQVVA